MKTLRVNHEDVLDVYDDEHEERIGQVAPSFDGWATYRATWDGRIVDRRIATSKTIEEAVAALDQS